MNPNMTGQMGQAMQQGAQSIGQLADHFSRLRDSAQINKAEIELNDRFNKAHNDAANDPDIWGAEARARENMRTAIDETANSITSMEARNLYKMKANLEAQRQGILISNTVKRRQIDFGKAALFGNVDSLTNQYYSATSEADRAKIKEGIVSAINEASQVGYIDREAGYKYQTKTLDHLNTGQVEYDIDLNPRGALTELEKGKEGIYKDLPEEKRPELMKKARYALDNQEEQEKQLREEAISNNESALIDQKIAGQLTPQQVREKRDNGEIGAKFADHLITALYSASARKAKDENKRSATFNKMADFILNPDNKQEDVRIELIKKNATGELKDDEFTALYQFNQLVSKDVVDKALPKKNLMQSLSFWTDEYAQQRPEVKARMFKGYMQRVINGTDPAAAVQEVIRKEVLNIHPQAANYPKTGQKVMDALGNLKKLFPSGDIEDAD